MKKAIALVVALLMLSAVCIPVIHAAVETVPTDGLGVTEVSESFQEDLPEYGTLRENSVIYTCRYQQELKTVEISGTVNHDVMITHPDHFIAVYKIEPGKTFEEILEQSDAEVLATTAIAVKFQFSLRVESVSDRFSRYAVVLSAPTGEVLLAAEPQYAAVEATVSDFSGDKSAIKGIRTDMLSVGGSLNAGSAIVEVYVDRLLSQTSSGYMYQIGGTYQYFDKAYIDRLDASVRTYSAGGCKVYLQFLFSDPTQSDTDTVAGRTPEALYSEDTLSLLSAFSEFFASRYDNYRSGRICGIIVGDAIDLRHQEQYSSYTLSEYAERYTFLVTVVANSARVCQPGLDIVLPFSDNNVYEKGSETALPEMILQLLEDRVSFQFPCSMLIESKASAEQIMKSCMERDKKQAKAEDGDTIGVENVTVFSEYLTRLSERYENAPKHFIFVWEVPADCRGNSLACAYAYSFYRLFSQPMMSSFVVSFSEAELTEATPILDIRKIIRSIDTEKSVTVTRNLLTYFDAEQWGEVLSLPSAAELSLRHFERADGFDLDTLAWKGSFSYAEFPHGNISGWYAGAFCGEIKSDYSKSGERILRASLQPKNTTEHAELLYLYEYTENYGYTPYVVFDLSVSDGGHSTDRLCQIRITFGDQQSAVLTESVVSVNERTKITVDLGKYADVSTVDYIKISCRMLEDEPSAYTLALYDLVGYSTVYSSEDLNTLIEEARAKIRNQQDLSDDGSGGSGLTWIIFGVLLAVSAVGVGLFMFFRKTEETRERDTDNERGTDPSEFSDE